MHTDVGAQTSKAPLCRLCVRGFRRSGPRLSHHYAFCLLAVIDSTRDNGFYPCQCALVHYHRCIIDQRPLCKFDYYPMLHFVMLHFFRRQCVNMSIWAYQTSLRSALPSQLEIRHMQETPAASQNVHRESMREKHLH